jgi:nucleoside phosphorylase
LIRAESGGLGVAEKTMSDAIIQPRRGKSSPRLGPVAVLAATEPDLEALRNALGFDSDPGRRLFISHLFTSSASLPGLCLTGPLVGAPCAVMVSESLIAWGARTLVFLGWCGAISGAVSIGDLVLPQSAFVDEGTSRHYIAEASEPAASLKLVRELTNACVSKGIAAHTGAVWTTDAPFRETAEKVSAFRRQGALAVEMECSALFTLGAFRGVEVAALLVVSDDLSSFTWKPGFKDPRFARGRESACHVIENFSALKEAS